MSILHFWTSLELLGGAYWLIFGATVIQIYSIIVIGMVLSGSAYARPVEYTRWLVTAGILYSLSMAGLISSALLSSGILYLAVSAGLMWFVIRRETHSHSVLDQGLGI